MSKGRMEAFSDGVLAIIITIMVLKLSPPESTTLEALKDKLPIFSSYVLSYIYVGMYWTNHHHLIQAAPFVSGKLLWKNLNCLFWMSLIPFSTEWMGVHPFAQMPTFLYGILLFICSISYIMLQYEVISICGKDSDVTKNIGVDLKGKLSCTAYLISIGLSLYMPVLAYIVYLVISLIWIIPDKRLESVLYVQRKKYGKNL